MIRLLRFLWTGSWHDHQWETIGQNSFTDDWGLWLRHGTQHILQCKTCGNIKKVKT